MVNMWPTRSNPFVLTNDIIDLYVWFLVQGWFMPHYVIGKQDEWKEWVGSSTNGWGPNSFSICRVNKNVLNK
jgi:hypothetical protein